MSFRRSFQKSNSSFFFSNEQAFLSSVLRLRRWRTEMFLVDAGLGTPRICMQYEPTGVPINRATRFENKVGFRGEKSVIKERTTTRFHDFFGSLDVVAGEPLLLPRKFRFFRGEMELQKILRTNKKVKGFLLDKVKGGYSVAIAGFITFLPFRSLKKKGGRMPAACGVIGRSNSAGGRGSRSPLNPLFLLDF
uniref:Ribosomal protein S1 n=1 Tax=Albidella oligococca TaxID=2890917 RepID=A0A1Z1R0C8_ALBOL|nr:ribosomal protein S1 [Albidella oligococca]